MVCPTHCDRTACVASSRGAGPRRVLAEYLPWAEKRDAILKALPDGATDADVLQVLAALHSPRLARSSQAPRRATPRASLALSDCF